jgi:hypothetical integral membrane protein (TIGR02206 family)
MAGTCSPSLNPSVLDQLWHQSPFVPLGTPHRAVLGVLALLLVGLILIARRYRSTPRGRRIDRGFALVILLGQLGFYAVEFTTPGLFTLQYSLPLQLCDLAALAAVGALWTHDQRWFGLTYYWGLTLGLLALVLPHIDFEFPHFEFIMFFFGHSAAPLAAAYLTAGIGLRPTWSAYRTTLAVTVAWGLILLVLNRWAGTNYMFVYEKPPYATPMDWFGPWPWYLLGNLATASVLWAAITWPWKKQEQNS